MKCRVVTIVASGGTDTRAAATRGQVTTRCRRNTPPVTVLHCHKVSQSVTRWHNVTKGSEYRSPAEAWAPCPALISQRGASQESIRQHNGEKSSKWRAIEMIKDSFCGDKEVSYTGIMADTSIHTPDTPGVDLGSSSHRLSSLHFFLACIIHYMSNAIKYFFLIKYF